MVPKLRVLSAFKFSKTQIKAVGEFQNYGGSVPSVGKALFAQTWPSQFTKYSKPIYRVVVLPKVMINAVLAGKSYKSMKASSWTKSEKIAREFIGMHWFEDFYSDLQAEGKEPTIVLLKKTFSGRVVDIDALHKNEDFKSTIEAFEDRGVFFSEGLDFGDSQQEVAVETFTMEKRDVVDAIPFEAKGLIDQEVIPKLRVLAFNYDKGWTLKKIQTNCQERQTWYDDNLLTMVKTTDQRLKIGYLDFGKFRRFVFLWNETCVGFMSFMAMNGVFPIGMFPDKDVMTPHAAFLPEFRGKGFASFVYDKAIKQGKVLVAKIHTLDAGKLWERVAEHNGLVVQHYDTSKTKFVKRPNQNTYKVLTKLTPKEVT